jgi:hypothetical protein
VAVENVIELLKQEELLACFALMEDWKKIRARNRHVHP